MSYYQCRICPHCGAALDSGEICDCMNRDGTESEAKRNREAALGAANARDGRGVKGFARSIHASSMDDTTEDCKR